MGTVYYLPVIDGTQSGLDTGGLLVFNALLNGQHRDIRFAGGAANVLAVFYRFMYDSTEYYGYCVGSYTSGVVGYMTGYYGEIITLRLNNHNYSTPYGTMRAAVSSNYISANQGGEPVTTYVDLYPDATTAIDAIKAASPTPPSYPITYHLTNCTAPTAPTEATSGATVTVPLQFTIGYSVVNSSDAYVMNNGVIVPSTYSNGTLMFTMP